MDTHGVLRTHKPQTGVNQTNVASPSLSFLPLYPACVRTTLTRPMRFSLLRRFSHLIHRRTRSDTFIINSPIQVVDGVTRSFSLNNVGEPARPSALDSFIPNNPFDTTFLASESPTPFSPTNPQTKSPIPTSQKLTAVNRRILELESEIARLSSENVHVKAANNALKFDTELLAEQLGFLENAERPLSSDVRLITKEALNMLKNEAIKCAEMEKLVKSLIDLGLQTEEPVFPRVYKAVMAGEPHDEAVVEAIRDAASKPTSPWSSIIPAVIGPRTNDQYISALNMTLQCRRENRELQAVKKFWKGVAKEDEANADLITPSASTLSAVHVPLSQDRQHAVDNLLTKLRDGTIPIRSQVLRQATVPLEPNLSNAAANESDVFASLPSLHPEPSTSSDISVSQSSSSGPSLAPLASQKFKEELIASHSSERFSIGSITTSYKQVRPVLASRDLNRPSAPAGKPSEKVLGKRKVTEIIQHAPVSVIHSCCKSVLMAPLQTDAIFEPACSNDVTESTSKLQYTLPDFPHDFSSGSSELDVFSLCTPARANPVNNGGNLGGTTSRDTTPDTTLINIANSSSSTRGEADTTFVEDTNNNSATETKYPTTPSPKKSLLPVLKKAPRRLSVTFATKPQSPARPSSPSSLRKPTISSMRKTVPPVSKPIAGHMKPTSPLRIKKKVNRAAPVPPVPPVMKDGRLKTSMKRLSRMVAGS